MDKIIKITYYHIWMNSNVTEGQKGTARTQSYTKAPIPSEK